MIGATTRFLARLRGDQRGVSAVEFAFIAPVMILFYFGMSEACQLMLADRKTVHTASAIGDLVAQSSQTINATGDGGLDDILSMSSTLMQPFTTGTLLHVCIASITANATTNVKKVDWSRATNSATCPAAGATITTVPTGTISAGQSVIFSQVTYNYTSPMNMVIRTNPVIVKTFYLRPRKVTTILCSGC